MVARAVLKNKSGVLLIEDNLDDVARSIKALAGKAVMVGVPAEETLRDPEPGAPSSPVNNALLAYIHDNGSPEQNIPARPFLKPGIMDAKSQIVAGLKRAGQAAFDGKLGDMDAALETVGLRAQASVRRRITTGPFAPLQDSTIENRLRRLAKYQHAGKKQRRKMMAKWLEGTFNPLIDTGQLRNAINYVIRRRPR